MNRGETLPTQDDDFVLANAISARIADATLELIAGGRWFPEQVTPVTAELLDYWFAPDSCGARDINFHRGQRDAILAVIYAHEVLGAETLPGLYDRAVGEWVRNPSIETPLVDAPSNQHSKYCVKMATGTGKTWVMNALLVWQYLNAVDSPGDRRFTRNFLIVAPGLIVYDRLLDSFLGKTVPGSAAGGGSVEQRDYATSDFKSHEQLFIPDQYRDRVHAFVQGSTVRKHEIGRRLTAGGVIAVTNWHLLAGKDREDPDFLPADLDGGDDVEAPGADVDARAAAASFLNLSPIKSGGHPLDTLDGSVDRGREFRWLRDLPGGLMVFDDEAHHIHTVKRADLSQPDAVEWQQALDALAAPRRAEHRYAQIDFTATPYVEAGGKKKKPIYFPHIVVDFDLRDAIGAGLVKSIALDKRSEVASLTDDQLEFRTEKGDDGTLRVSDGQATMLRAGLAKLDLLEHDFAAVDLPGQPVKHPKMLILTENTEASKAVERYLRDQVGLDEDDLLRVDSDRKGEVKPAEWSRIRDQLSGLDRTARPRIVISVLMLREGFDVNSICVIVPLRAAQSGILLEQVVGRGLRLMWRGDDDIDAQKRDTRERIANHLEPRNRFDVLSIVEHPAFEDWYREQLGDGLFGEEGDDQGTTPSTGDIEVVSLRDDWERYDIRVPFIQRDAEEELRTPSIDVAALESSKYPFADFKRRVGTGEHWASQDLMEGTRYGDYRVDGGVFTATGYNDYLARIAKRLSDTVEHAYTTPDKTFTTSAKKAKQMAEYPVLQVARPQLIAWIDRYIRTRMFGRPLEPLTDENWRVLLLPEIAGEVVRAFGPALVSQLDRTTTIAAQVWYRSPAEVKTFRASAKRLQDTGKCIYPKLRIPPEGKGGGLERDFVDAAEQDGRVEAYVKLDEHQHAYLQRPYLKDNGYPARYSPDFLVRTGTDVYVVETKSQTGLSDANVQRKRAAALAWVSRIEDLPAVKRENRDWHYVLLGERTFQQHRRASGGLVELLEFASLASAAAADQHLAGL